MARGPIKDLIKKILPKKKKGSKKGRVAPYERDRTIVPQRALETKVRPPLPHPSYPLMRPKVSASPAEIASLTGGIRRGRAEYGERNPTKKGRRKTERIRKRLIKKYQNQ